MPRLTTFSEAAAAKNKQVDEDVNNKMFIVVRNLKSSSTKTVSNSSFI